MSEIEKTEVSQSEILLEKIDKYLEAGENNLSTLMGNINFDKFCGEMNMANKSDAEIEAKDKFIQVFDNAVDTVVDNKTGDSEIVMDMFGKSKSFFEATYNMDYYNEAIERIKKSI